MELEKKYTKAVQDAKLLHDQHTNTEILKEEVYQLRSKVERYEQMHQKYTQMQVEHEALLAEKQKW